MGMKIGGDNDNNNYCNFSYIFFRCLAGVGSNSLAIVGANDPSPRIFEFMVNGFVILLVPFCTNEFRGGPPRNALLFFLDLRISKN